MIPTRLRIATQGMSEVDILARTLDGEARGEGVAGMTGVGWVVMNRVARPGWWGSDVTSVCLAACQFSSWMASDPNFKRMTDPNWSNPVAFHLAQAVMSKLTPDNTGGATGYLTTALFNSDHCPEWAVNLKPTAVINHQTFFKVP